VNPTDEQRAEQDFRRDHEAELEEKIEELEEAAERMTGDLAEARKRLADVTEKYESTSRTVVNQRAKVVDLMVIIKRFHQFTGDSKSMYLNLTHEQWEEVRNIARFTL
jgi:chromosome segregation ATPase